MDRFTKIMKITGMVLLLVQAIYASPYQFPYRQELDREVRFWKQIFTHFSRNQYVLHDSEYPWIQYSVLTFDESLPQRQRDRIIRQEKQKIRQVLLKIHEFRNQPGLLNEKEKRIYRQFEEIQEADKFLAAAGRIRAQQGIREQFKAGVERSFAYLPHIKKVFRLYGLPEEVGYLPHMESSFNPRAVSHVRAVGMWQFMRSTARHFMRVNRIRDERWDPYVSTHGAARLLKRNYQALQDWGLAITAYNYGLAGLKRAVKQFGRDYLKIRKNYLSRRFGFASRNFYPEFLAVVEIVDSLQLYFPELNPHRPWEFHEILLPAPVKLPQLASAFHIPLDTLKQLNPAYRNRVWQGRLTVPAGYPVRLPKSVNAAAVLAYLQLQAPPTLPQLASQQSNQKAVAARIPIAYQILPDRKIAIPANWWQRAHANSYYVENKGRFHLQKKEPSDSPRRSSPVPEALIAFIQQSSPLYESDISRPMLANIAPSWGDVQSWLPRVKSANLAVIPPQVTDRTAGAQQFAYWKAYMKQGGERRVPQLAFKQATGSHPLLDESSSLSRQIHAYTHYLTQHMPEQTVFHFASREPSSKTENPEPQSIVSYAAVTVPQPSLETHVGGPSADAMLESDGIGGSATQAKETYHIITRQSFQQTMRKALTPDARGRIVVFQGETLEHFARWLGVSVLQIRKWNHLQGNRLQVGQRLTVHFLHTTIGQFVNQRFQFHWGQLPPAIQHARHLAIYTHRVKSGETLSSIARWNSQITVNILLYFNEFHKLRRIYPGDLITGVKVIN